MRIAAIATLVVLLSFMLGCGSAAVGAAAYFVAEDGEETEPATYPPDAPIVIISSISGIHSGDVDMGYVISDRNSDTVDSQVEFSTDSGATWRAATESLDAILNGQSDGTTGLDSSPTGISYTFVWDSLADIGAGTLDTVQFQITASDTSSGSGPPAKTPDDFTVDNTPPTVQVIPLTGSQGDEVALAYKITDGASDPADIVVEYSTDAGLSYQTAAESTLNPFSEGTTNLASSADGTLHIFVWDSQADCSGFLGEEVRIRITPSDSLSGLPVATVDFTLDNNTPPVAIVGTPATPPAKKGNVLIQYLLADAESDICSISAKYSTDGGATWANATRGSGGDPLDTLTSSASGEVHAFVWNTIADIGYCSEIPVRVAILPGDSKAGTPGASGAFLVNNNLAPAASILTPSGEQSGEFLIYYYLFDGGSDVIEITASFSPDGGESWQAATLSASAPEGTTPLASSPSGYPHFFKWDTSTDMAGEYSANVVFRIVPTDEGGNVGDPALSDLFIVSNNAAPSINVTDISSPASGDVTVDYYLYDAESQNCDVVVEYALSGSASAWLTATMASGSEPATKLNSSPGGVYHTFTWDSAADIDSYAKDVLIRATPYDLPGRAGSSDTTAPFVVDNSNWSLPEMVAMTQGYSMGPAVAASHDGSVHIVWSDSSLGNHDIYYIKKTGDTGNGQPLNLTPTPVHSIDPDIAAGTDGTLHVVWREWANTSYQLFYRKFDGSRWLPSTQLTQESGGGGGNVSHPSIALDKNNNPWIAYADMYKSNGYQIFCIRYSGLTPVPPELVSPIDTEHMGSVIRSGPAGEIMHLVYNSNYNPGAVYYTTNSGSGWSSRETVYESDNVYEPDLSVDASGNAHVVWQDYSGIQYSTNASGSWSSLIAITTGSEGYLPQVAAYSPYQLYAVWNKYGSIYSSQSDGSTWSAGEDISGMDSNEPYMRRGLDGRVHLVYQKYVDMVWQIYYSSR